MLVQSGNGKMPPLGSDDDGDRCRDRWSKLKSITLRHCGEISVNSWINEPGEVSYREGKLRIDEFVGKLGARLLDYFEVGALRRERMIDIRFPGGVVWSNRSLNADAGCEYTVALTLDLIGVDSLAASERVTQLSKEFQWHELELGFNALLHPQRLLAACRDTHVSVESFWPGGENDHWMRVIGSAFGWGQEGQPATVTFANGDSRRGLTGFMIIRQKGRYGGDAPLESNFYDKLNPDTIIPLFLSAFTEPNEGGTSGQ